MTTLRPALLALGVATSSDTQSGALQNQVRFAGHSLDEDELCEDDLDFNDDSETTDTSSDLSTINSPVVKVASSPCSVDDVAVASGSAWSARPVRRKRKRMGEDERKVRHREVQRQFMKRKRARIAVLRKEQCGVEKQLRLVRVLVEVEMLKNEKEALQQHYEACETAKTHTKDNQVSGMSLGDLVFSVPPEDTHEDYVMTELDWSELYDMLCDDASDINDGCSLSSTEEEL